MIRELNLLKIYDNKQAPLVNDLIYTLSNFSNKIIITL